MKVLIYGYSDDLIEVEGDFGDEFPAYNCWKYLHFNDGTIVKVGYAMEPGKGWHIEIEKMGTSATPKFLIPKMDGDEHYSDHLELEGDDLTSVECWGSFDGPTADDMLTFWEDFDSRDYKTAVLIKAYRVLTDSG